MEATPDALPLPPEIEREILESRARRLAERPPRGVGDDGAIEVLVFVLGGERFAAETRHVRQVIRPGPRTPVPGGGELLRGLANLDGDLLPVFDLGRALGVEGAVGGDGARVVVLGEDRDEFGVDVDLALEVTALRLDLLSRPPGDDARGLVRGIAPGPSVLLDGDRLLADGRFFIDRAD